MKKVQVLNLICLLVNAYTYRSILTNDHKGAEKKVVEYYNARGSSKKIFDEMNNDFGWNLRNENKIINTY